MDFISPKYRVSLIENIEKAIWETYKSYTQVYMYMTGWQQYKNFDIITSLSNKIMLSPTLNNIDSETLLKIAIDLGVDTPDFIPSIPTFRNVIKVEYATASVTFESAYKKIETEPEIAIGLANSALESIIKEILKDTRITTQWKDNDTLYSLTKSLLKEFKMLPTSDMPEEIKTIGSSLAAIAQGIEKLRSDKTLFHGKTDGDYVISDSMYVYFIINSICTVGMFLRSFYKQNYPKQEYISINDLPF